MATTIVKLCEGLPPQFSKYFKYVRNLGFDEKPDYGFLMKLLLDMISAGEGTEDSLRYVWEETDFDDLMDHIQKLENSEKKNRKKNDSLAN